MREDYGRRKVITPGAKVVDGLVMPGVRIAAGLFRTSGKFGAGKLTPMLSWPTRPSAGAVVTLGNVPI